MDMLTGSDVATYLRYLVEVKGSAIATVTGAIAAINDHLRYEIEWNYNPCGAAIVAQMRHILIPLAKQATQKKVIELSTLTAIHAAAAATRTDIGRRDSATFMLAYFGLLRISEVVRLNRKDINFTYEQIDGARTVVMRVHVDRMCKNDTKREGHERIIAQATDGRHCVATQMMRYLNNTKGTAESALFTTATGERLNIDTPRGRLKHWLKATGVEGVERYGFH